MPQTLNRIFYLKLNITPFLYLFPKSVKKAIYKIYYITACHFIQVQIWGPSPHRLFCRRERSLCRSAVYRQHCGITLFAGFFSRCEGRHWSSERADRVVCPYTANLIFLRGKFYNSDVGNGAPTVPQCRFAHKYRRKISTISLFLPVGLITINMQYPNFLIFFYKNYTFRRNRSFQNNFHT